MRSHIAVNIAEELCEFGAWSQKFNFLSRIATQTQREDLLLTLAEGVAHSLMEHREVPSPRKVLLDCLIRKPSGIQDPVSKEETEEAWDFVEEFYPEHLGDAVHGFKSHLKEHIYPGSLWKIERVKGGLFLTHIGDGREIRDAMLKAGQDWSRFLVTLYGVN